MPKTKTISKRRNRNKNITGSGFFDVVRKIKDSVKNISNKIQQFPLQINAQYKF